MSVLKSLFAYAGRHKYLTMLSLLFSLISAVFLLMPFLWIWKVVEEVLKVYPDFTQAADAAKIWLVCAVLCRSRHFDLCGIFALFSSGSVSDCFQYEKSGNASCGDIAFRIFFKRGQWKAPKDH